MANQLLVTLAGTDNPYLKPRLPLVGMLELFEIGTHGKLISAVFRIRRTVQERTERPGDSEFGAPVDVANPVFIYGATPTLADRPDQLNLHARDSTLTLRSVSGRTVVAIEPAGEHSGVEEAAIILDEEHMARLRHWALTGVAVARGEAS